MALTAVRGAGKRPPSTVRSLKRRAALGNGLWYLGIAVSAIAVGAAAAHPSDVRLALAVSGLALAAGLATRAGPGLIYALVVWTTIMGTVRRLFSSPVGANQTDPLLLVAVGAIVVLTAAAADRGAFGQRTRLANAVLVFDVLAALEALNPKQGGLRLGVTALAFVLVPTLAFWVGRALCTERTVTLVAKLLAGLALVVAIYGLLQTFVGFPPWDTRWITNSGYSSLSVNNTVRAFGSFASSQEYAVYLSVGFVIWVAYGLAKKRIVVPLIAAALTFTALFYESSRTPVILTIFAAGLVMVVTRVRRPMLVLGCGVALVVLVSLISSHFSSSAGTEATTTGTGGLAAHQINGLAHPFSNSSSTLNGHLTEVRHGFDVMLHNPLGLGGAVINIVGSKSGVGAINTEFDPSNVAVALGVPGLLAYLVIVFEGFRIAVERARDRHDFASRAALGIIAVTFLQWTNGGLYSVAFLPWLMMGWFDRDVRDSTPAAVSASTLPNDADHPAALALRS
jgi:hypothetical protein